MNLNLFNICLLIFTFFVGSSSFASNESNTHASSFSLRARPLALASGIGGAEAYYHFTEGSFSGVFMGIGIHYADQVNDLRITALTTWESGIRIGKLFGPNAPHSGWFVYGNLNLYSTKVSGYYTNPPGVLAASFNQFGEAIFAGYQFQATLVGERWDLRLGLGAGYKPDYQKTYYDSLGNAIPIGVRKRFDPSLEFTVGYLI